LLMVSPAAGKLALPFAPGEYECRSLLSGN
jgi:hypothetical protein